MEIVSAVEKVEQSAAVQIVQKIVMEDVDGLKIRTYNRISRL